LLVSQGALRNQNRMDYLIKLQEMIDEYRSGSINVETFFKRLVQFSPSLRAI